MLEKGVINMEREKDEINSVVFRLEWNISV